MAYRELQGFAEAMRHLGYPRVVSIDAFRYPNFELASDCLQWLYQKYDPNYVSVVIADTEEDKSTFLMSMASGLWTKARFKLNMKRIYSADGAAVKELLRLAQCLRLQEAEDNEVFQAAATIEPNPVVEPLDVGSLRLLTTELCQLGESVAYCLYQEEVNAPARASALKAFEDDEQIERAIWAATAENNAEADAIEKELLELQEEQEVLQPKVDRLRAEIDSCRKRLTTMQSVRPAHMDEVDVLQEKMQTLYNTYLKKFRNVQYLEQELANYMKQENQAAVASEKKLKKLQKRLQDQELRILRGECDVTTDDALPQPRPFIFDDEDTSSDEEAEEEWRRASPERLQQSTSPERYGFAATPQAGQAGGYAMEQWHSTPFEGGTDSFSSSYAPRNISNTVTAQAHHPERSSGSGLLQAFKGPQQADIFVNDGTARFSDEDSLESGSDAGSGF